MLAEGTGPTASCELCQAKNLASLSKFEPYQPWRPIPPEGKWSAALLPSDSSHLYTEVVGSKQFSILEDWGDTTLGMVTGNNRYFALRQEQARSLGLGTRELLPLCPPGSRHLRGPSFTKRAWADMAESDARVYLFDPDKLHLSKAAAKYINEGERQGVHKAYKCRVRTPWWRVPRVGVPDLFFTYMNYDTPRLVSNKARVPYLNSVHGVFLKKGLRKVGPDPAPP